MTRSKNVYQKIGLDYAELKDYVVCAESIAQEALPSGWDWQYCIINKLTGVVENRVGSLPMAVIMMQSMQQLLEKVKTGEANGYAMPPEQQIKAQG